MGRFWLFREVRLWAAAALFGLFFSSQPAVAEFTVSPLRQVITADEPHVTYEISNPSSRTLEARISWIDLRAVETGYVDADPELREQLSAAPYLIVSPNFLTLEPGARETITVKLRGGARVPKGERRSHLLIESNAVRTLLRKAGGGVQLDLETGLSTPVILRGGKGSVRASIKDARLLRRPDSSLELETMIEPKGDFSAYGHIAVFFADNSGGQETEIARVANIAAWLDAPLRKAVIPLNIKKFNPGVVTIRYVGDGEFEGAQFAERSFKIKKRD